MTVEGWRTYRLVEVCLKVAKGEPSKFGLHSFPYIDIGSLESKSDVLHKAEIIKAAGAPSRARQLVKTGDTVFSTVRPYQLKIARIGDELDGAIASTGFCVLRPNQELVDPRFLGLFANSPHLVEQVLPKQRGVSYPAVSDKDVLSCEINLPSLDEQRKIVDTLEDHLSRLDKALAEVQGARAKASSFLASTMELEFDSCGPAHTKISQLAAVKGGKRLPKGTPWSSFATDHPYIRSTDIKNGYVNPSNLVYVPDEVWSSVSRYTVDVDDVLVTIAGTIGQTAVVGSELQGANLTENAAKICLQSDHLKARFLELYLRSPKMQREMASLARATTQPKLALYRIEEIQVPVPPIEVQDEILSKVESHQSAHTQIVRECRNVEIQIGTLRRALLQAAFSGNLVKE